MPNEEKEKLIFRIPKCGITAEFERYKNSNWSMSLRDNRDNVKRLVCKSMDKYVMTKIVEDLIGQPPEQNGLIFKKSYKIFKRKVENIKESKKNKNYAKNL